MLAVQPQEEGALNVQDFEQKFKNTHSGYSRIS